MAAPEPMDPALMPMIRDLFFAVYKTPEERSRVSALAQELSGGDDSDYYAYLHFYSTDPGKKEFADDYKNIMGGVKLIVAKKPDRPQRTKKK